MPLTVTTQYQSLADGGPSSTNNPVTLSHHPHDWNILTHLLKQDQKLCNDPTWYIFHNATKMKWFEW